VERNGLRGSAAARVDDKGRLKIPTAFRGLQDQQGPDVFVTSLSGESALIYPIAVWLEVEQKLLTLPNTHPSRLKYLDIVNYYGQESELDSQGRIVIPAHLRESASIVGDCRVFGRITHLEVWNEQRFLQRLQTDSWTKEDGLRLSELGF
jgi:MraZ protein